MFLLNIFLFKHSKQFLCLSFEKVEVKYFNDEKKRLKDTLVKIFIWDKWSFLRAFMPNPTRP
jgi:hypothetical protein